MKTLKFVLPLLIAGMAFNLSPARAQEFVPTFEYFTLKSCGNDTLQYLEKNYGSRGQRYDNKTFELLINDTKNDVPFTSCWTYLIDDGTVIKFVFFIDPVKKVKERIKKGLPLWCVNVSIWTALSPKVKDPGRKKLYETLEKLGFNKIQTLDKRLYNLIKDIKVEFTYWEYELNFDHTSIVI
jgi:hypothetical protein